MDAGDAARFVREAEGLCARRGGRLLFLVVFGSRLYGTQEEGASDLDLYGLWMPLPAALVTGCADGDIRAGTAGNLVRHGSGDVDIALFSLRRWLLELLPRGEVVGTDLLFAAGRPGCVLFRDPLLDAIFGDPLRYLGLRDGRACRAYCIRQARQYGIRGSRLGCLKDVLRALEALCPEGLRAKARLADILEGLLARCGDGRLCLRAPEGEGAALVLCGRHYQASLPVALLAERVQAVLAATRCAGIDADRGLGVDWKALSHALRAQREDEEILATGRLRFPLACAGELKAVRAGLRPWRELEPLLVDNLEALDRLRAVSPHAHAVDPAVSRQALLACYGIDEDATAFPAGGSGGR